MRLSIRWSSVLSSLQGIFILIGATVGISGFGLLQPSSVYAEDPIEYKNVQVWVQPEYDDPRLLVMVEGTVSRPASASKQVRFLVPTDAEMFSAGSIDASGNYKGGPPGRTPSNVDGFDEIFFELGADRFRVEYYTNAVRGTSEKTVDFAFRTIYTIRGLTVSVQQPLKATNFRVQPPNQTTSKAEGFNYFDYAFDALTAEKPLNLTINYTKTDTSPSIQQGNAPLQTSATDNSRLDLTWPVLAVIVAGAGLVAYYVGKSQGSSSSHKERRSREERRRQGTSGRRELAPRDTTTQRAPRGNRKASSLQVAERPKTSAQGVRAEHACPSCRQFVDDGSLYCPYCGTEL